MRRFCLTLYAIYALCYASMLLNETSLAGMLVLTLAVFITNSRRKAAAGTLWESHLQWMGRTFWIGAGVYMMIAFVVQALLVFGMTDLGDVLLNSDPETLNQNISAVLDGNNSKVTMITLLTMLPPTLWCLYRCWNGFALAQQEQPVDDVMRWT